MASPDDRDSASGWAEGSARGSDPPYEGLPGERRLLPLLLAGAGLLALLALGVAAYAYFGDAPLELRPTILRDGDREQLRVEVLEAPAGLRIRFGEEERLLEQGAALFPLPIDLLHLGENPLQVDVVHASGQVEARRIALELRHRAYVDLAGLEAESPSLLYIVEAIAGSSVELGGEALPLDPSGRAQRRVPIDPEPSPEAIAANAAPGLAFLVRFPDGSIAEGSLAPTLPYASLLLERPGEALITEAAEARVAGTAEPEALIRLGAETLALEAGRFDHRLPLPELGERRFELWARAPGKAPRRRSFTIRRVESLAAEAAAFGAERRLEYARLRDDPEGHRGSRISIVGRIYNVRTERGVSDLQVLVRECPGRDPCPLWVHYPAVGEHALGDWIQIVGLGAGLQQFRAQSGELSSAPRIDAALLLPVSP
ncbi:MAG: hypothetical protein OEY14_11655 [Myxococcales bacterium]|nr:hypothetical protein [Myxococcales bacterium]